jgi:YfiR/HmsC-like
MGTPHGESISMIPAHRRTVWPPALLLLGTFLLGALPLAVTLTREALAQTAAPTLYDVQAVYLFDFTKFVRWPAASEHETISICIAGQQVFADSLTRIVAGERIDSHTLSVRLVQQAQDETACDILFIGSAAEGRLDSLLAATNGKPILTVSDVPGFLDRGGMIQFLIVGNRVRFSVDLRPVARSGISVSSELLKVAVAVKGPAAVGGGAQ